MAGLLCSGLLSLELVRSFGLIPVGKSCLYLGIDYFSKTKLRIYILLVTINLPCNPFVQAFLTPGKECNIKFRMKEIHFPDRGAKNFLSTPERQACLLAPYTGR
jgi:hypothetical protein